jgi:DNA-binding NarL/FixJ family response regulator
VSDRSAQSRILAVDDHVLVREGIAVLLSTEPDMALVAEAANGREAVQQFRAHRPGQSILFPHAPFRSVR